MRWLRAGALVALFLAAVTGLAAKAPRSAGLEPKFVPPGGVFTNQVAVRLEAPASGVVVRFTLDGSEPTAEAPVCTNAITLTNCALVRARVFDAEGPAGPVVSHSYVVLEPGLGGFDSNLPLVVLDSLGAEVPFALRVPAAVRVIEPQAATGRAALTGPASFEGRALVCLRGRSSLRYPKRSYNLRLIDEAGDPLKAPLLGLPADWDWVLYAPFPDKTLMRDVLAFEWSRQMGRYASRARFVEVFVNESASRLTEQDYRGVYVLLEKVKQGKHRVNIAPLGPGDLTEPAVTGGYLFKKDHRDIFEPGPVEADGFPEGGGTSPPRFGFPTGPGSFPADPAGFLPPHTERTREPRPMVRFAKPDRPDEPPAPVRLGSQAPFGRRSASPPRLVREDEFHLPEHLEGWTTTLTTNQFYFVDPAPDELNPVQRAWLISYVEALERALYGPQFRDPTVGYAAYLDPDSFIDYHLLVEVTKNVDGFRFSTFYHKDRGGRLQMGPIWDWNLSLGNATGKQGYLWQYWLWPQLDDQEYTWFRRLFEDPDFGQRYVDRWAELRRTVFATSNVLAQIDALAQRLDEAQKRNFQRWPILGVKVTPNYYVGQTYADEVNWMKQWISNRLAWLDKQFLPAPLLTVSNNYLHLQAPTGTVFFTLDGTDPRAAGGAPAPQAKPFTEPIPAQPGARLVARTRLDHRWSPPTVHPPANAGVGSAK